MQTQSAAERGNGAWGMAERADVLLRTKRHSEAMRQQMRALQRDRDEIHVEEHAWLRREVEFTEQWQACSEHLAYMANDRGSDLATVAQKIDVQQRLRRSLLREHEEQDLVLLKHKSLAFAGQAMPWCSSCCKSRDDDDDDDDDTSDEDSKSAKSPNRTDPYAEEVENHSYEWDSLYFPTTFCCEESDDSENSESAEEADGESLPLESLLGSWACVDTWGLEDFLKGNGVGMMERMIATKAKWPRWEFCRSEDHILFLNHAMVGVLKEEMFLDREYQQTDGRGNVWASRAEWVAESDGACVLRTSRTGKMGAFVEERRIKGETLEFTLKQASGLSWGRSFRRERSGIEGAAVLDEAGKQHKGHTLPARPQWPNTVMALWQFLEDELDVRCAGTVARQVAKTAGEAWSWASLRSKGIALMSATALEEFHAQHLASAFQAFAKLLLHDLHLMPATGARARLVVTEPDAQQLSNTLRALGRLSFSGHLTIDAAAHQVQSAHSLFGPQETSNRTRTPTSSVLLDLALLEGLADQAIRMAPHFDPQGLAMVARSFATCELRDLPLFDTTGEHVLRIIHELDPQFTAISARDPSTPAALSISLMQALARRGCASATELGPQSPSNLARALGRPELRGSPVLDATAATVLDRSSECSPLNSSNLARGLGTLRDGPGSLLTALGRESTGKLPEPSGQQLANMVWGFAWLSFLDASWMEAHSRFARPLLPEHTPQGLCNTAQKPAKLVAFGEALMMSACHEAQKRFHVSQPQNFSNFVCAYEHPVRLRAALGHPFPCARPNPGASQPEAVPVVPTEPVQHVVRAGGSNIQIEVQMAQKIAERVPQVASYDLQDRLTTYIQQIWLQFPREMWPATGPDQDPMACFFDVTWMVKLCGSITTIMLLTIPITGRWALTIWELWEADGGFVYRASMMIREHREEDPREDYLEGALVQENGARGPHHATSPLHALQPRGCTVDSYNWMRQCGHSSPKARTHQGSSWELLPGAAFGSKLPATPPASGGPLLAMPTVSVFYDCLQKALGNDVTEESFDELCFEFGLELDDVTSQKEMVEKERGADAAADMSDRVIFKVDVPANRYDLLCIEGLVRSLQIFKGVIPAPLYKLSMPKPLPQMTMTVKKETAQIRPFVVCAILRNVTFDKDRYDSFIELQDKLHQNICRKRTLVAIGTHDLSTLKPPFTYEALPPNQIHFTPLNQTEEMDGNRMMEVLSAHQQLKTYLPIIRSSPVYPVIYDSNRVVLSLPPIINGEHSKIKMETKDVFIECTATDLTKANIVLNTVVAMFAEYCKEPFVAEPVEVIYESDYPGNSFIQPGDKRLYPALEPRAMKAKISRMKASLGLDKLSGAQVRDYLRKMSLPCDIDSKDADILDVQVPITRSDIMHECDLIEDLAIAYGYNNLETSVPQTVAVSAGQPVNNLSDLARGELAMAGYTECMNWSLLSKKENFTFMRRESKVEELWRTVKQPYEYIPTAPAVSVSNPKTKDFEIIRTSMMPGILKTLANSKQLPPPIKLFEVGDVVIQEPTREVGCKNVRRLVAVHANMRSQFSLLHGVLDQLMYSLNCEPEHEHKEGSKRRTFKLVPSEDPAFFVGMQAHVVCEGINIGIIGELHPEVLSSKGFDINLPTSAFELNLEPFLEWL
ncbi:putative phenylalanine--tRNA ligase beta subunit [Symbiodinium microadriaticum]|uniref:phenylalanine--tRNA ligase n=1 Tax=Symbiodinium microadriaticum TaxID=2951 RepID=A0A1Q9DA57_SYMMI|nr:putative phenylalanine--tRNA ligase beta subunit [Symbiodinium microadriaticum]